MYKSTILIVDDEAFGRQTLGTLLEANQYTLAFASNGQEALTQAANLSPDLVLLDVMMPDMDGFEVCRRLRADPNLAEVPVIMVTALDDRESRLQGIEAGADDLVTKPFDPVELRGRVRTITRLNRYRRLLSSRDVLRAIFDGLDNGLLLLDRDSRVLVMNHAMATLLGTTTEQIVGQQWSTLCNSSATFPGQSALKALRDGRARRHREQYTNIEGAPRVLDVQILPLLGPQHRVEQVILHIVDITERLQLETLAIQNEHFAARGRLAAFVAHEVNTPLQSIQNCLYLAGKANADQRNVYLELAREELKRISSIVRQLLDKPHPVDNSSPSLINVNSLIHRVLLLTDGTLTSHGIDVQCDLTPNPPLVLGHADHLTQVLLNIILNSVDAMPDGGKMRIQTGIEQWGMTCERNEQPQDDDDNDDEDTTNTAGPQQSDTTTINSFIVDISDTGCGMSIDIQARIFAPFFTTKPQGSGVGLSISQRIVAQHGGEIKVHSVPGQGSTFTIALPVHSTLPHKEPL